MILNVEVANKEHGAKMRKWDAPGVKSKNGTAIPEGVPEKEVWTYVHGIDKMTGKVLWREEVGTSIHNTIAVGNLPDARLRFLMREAGPMGRLRNPMVTV